jgi:hypothetical protein
LEWAVAFCGAVSWLQKIGKNIQIDRVIAQNKGEKIS